MGKVWSTTTPTSPCSSRLPSSLSCATAPDSSSLSEPDRLPSPISLFLASPSSRHHGLRRAQEDLPPHRYQKVQAWKSILHRLGCQKHLLLSVLPSFSK